MVLALSHITDNHAIGARKAVNKRLNGDCTKANFRVGYHDTGLDHITLGNFHFQSLIHNLYIHSVLSHFAALNGILATGEKGKDSTCNFKVISAAVTLRQKGSGCISQGTDHIIVGSFPKPGVYIVRKKTRLLGLHQIIVFCRNSQCGSKLAMEKGSGMEVLLATHLKRLSVIKQTELSCRCDKVALHLVLVLQLN